LHGDGDACTTPTREETMNRWLPASFRGVLSRLLPAAALTGFWIVAGAPIFQL
jgi:hypothetical protein